jgi:hypothetical protein
VLKARDINLQEFGNYHALGYLSDILVTVARIGSALGIPSASTIPLPLERL